MTQPNDKESTMPVTSVSHDLDTMTLVMNAEFAAPVERIWAIYADARQLEKVWGPPTYPATFVSHELKAETRSTYVMTGPEGEKHAGFFLITHVDEEAKTFSFDDGFCDLDFNPLPDMPVSHNVFSFTEVDGVTHASFVGTYESADAMQQVLDMGMVEGATEAIKQIDQLVA